MWLKNVFLAAVIAAVGISSFEVVRADEGGVLMSKRDKEIIAQFVVPELASAGKVGRLYYLGTCSSVKGELAMIPALKVRAPSKGKAGLASIREMFQADERVAISERPDGIVRITVGSVSKALLETKIKFLRLSPMQQYNRTLAISAIENSREVQTAMHELNFAVSPTIVNEMLVQPQEGAPHLNPMMANLTMDEALDAIAKSFGGVVIYGVCMPHRLISIEYTGGAYFEP